MFAQTVHFKGYFGYLAAVGLSVFLACGCTVESNVDKDAGFEQDAGDTDGGQNPDQDRCPTGLRECAGVCVDVNTNPFHCGNCNIACLSTEACIQGACVGCEAECVAGQKRCVTGANAFQSCTSSGGCPVWGSPQDCPANLVCDGDGVCADGCYDQCTQSGASFCDASGLAYRTCGQLDADNCLDLSEPVECPAGQFCQGGQCISGCTDLCTPQGGKRCYADGYEICQDHDYDGCVEWGGHVACPDGTSCDNGECVSGCNDQCGPQGAKVCSGDGYDVCSDYNSDGCVEWGGHVACPTGTTCENGECVSSCVNLCGPLGAKQCSGDGYDVCGDFNGDSCLEWGGHITCPAGTSCDNGECVAGCTNQCSPQGSKICSGDGYDVCNDYNSDGCWEWGGHVACPAGTACQNGECVPSCTHDCQPQGAQQCSGDGYDVCDDYDADSCWEWGGHVSCPAGQSCNPQTNQCEQSSDTCPEPTWWLDFQEENSRTDSSWGPVLTDIVQHCPLDIVDWYYDSDKVTHGHETTHGINSELRNYHNNTGQDANGFYCQQDRAAIIVEPDYAKTQVAAYVPQSLRGSRFSMYLQTNTWNNPLYIWDEWISYANGTSVGVNLVNQGMWSYGWRDACMGTLEFVVYGVAVGMATEDLDSTYFNSQDALYQRFHEFMCWLTRRSMDLYRQCAVMEPFQWAQQDEYYEDMRTSSDAADWRDYLVRQYGQGFLNEVLDLP